MVTYHEQSHVPYKGKLNSDQHNWMANLQANRDIGFGYRWQDKTTQKGS